ncbi:MAG: EF-P lysine aminoacylase EpmA [Planctomycetaceae bacterium]
MIRSDVTLRHTREQALPPDRLKFGPTASLFVLRLRAEMLHWVRRFFRERGYWEVETPLLSHDVCVDAWLEPFCVDCGRSTGSEAMYLQTSPEFGMKRLLAAGADSIFQITRAFRQEERGPLHNPEFTIIEWYRSGDTYLRQMDFVEELAVGFQTGLRSLLTQVDPDATATDGGIALAKLVPPLSRPIPRITYEDAFTQSLGEAVLSLPVSRLVQLAHARGIVPPRSLDGDDRDGWLNLLFLEAVEPLLAQSDAAFVFDYPASQAALARVRRENPPLGERFELFLRGVEICNGYQELTDPAELRERFAAQSQKRSRAGLPALPVESRLLTAMEAGLADCAGVALGFDRLLMALLGAPSLDDVIAFPFDRA